MTTSNQNDQSLSLGSVKDAVQERNQQFAAAMAKGDAAAVAACYTIDAEFMAPGAPAVAGRSNIETALAGFIDQGFTAYSVLEATVYGNIDVVGVQAAYSLGKPNGDDTDLGKSVQLWKQEDGAWKIFRDCFNSNLTP